MTAGQALDVAFGVVMGGTFLWFAGEFLAILATRLVGAGATATVTYLRREVKTRTDATGKVRRTTTQTARLAFRDHAGQERQVELHHASDSPEMAFLGGVFSAGVFQLEEGMKVPVRYFPRWPGRVYFHPHRLLHTLIVALVPGALLAWAGLHARGVVPLGPFNGEMCAACLREPWRDFVAR